MLNFVRKILRRRENGDVKAIFRTDLFVSNETLEAYARRRVRWEVRVNAVMPPDDKQVFYRNLIRLTVVHKVDRDLISLVVHGPTEAARVVAEQLCSRGFRNVALETAEEEKPEMKSLPGDMPRYEIDEFPVAGLQYHIQENDPIWSEIEPGNRVILKAEPENPHDLNAVGIVYPGASSQRMLGYVPRDRNKIISALLRAGYGDALEGVVASNNPGSAYFLRLNVRVSIKATSAMNVNRL